MLAGSHMESRVLSKRSSQLPVSMPYAAHLPSTGNNAATPGDSAKTLLKRALTDAYQAE